MLVRVLEGPSDTQNVRWINGLHAPVAGVVVAHVPGDCPQRELAIELLCALGRLPDEKEATKDIVAWATAWLATAPPRCDLVIYGAARLHRASLAWLADLAAIGPITVWLVASEQDAGAAAISDAPVDAIWSWQTFKTRPWRRQRRQRLTRATLCGQRRPPGWMPDDLPPFPFSRLGCGRCRHGHPSSRRWSAS